MRTPTKLTALVAGMALTVAPGAALAAGQGHGVGKPDPKPAKTKTKKDHSPKEFGKLCQSESKKHVKGEKGTPFSRCVVAMAQLDKGTKTNPSKACATESKKHVAGQKGTPFSQCVAGGEKLLKEKAGSSTGHK